MGVKLMTTILQLLLQNIETQSGLAQTFYAVQLFSNLMCREKHRAYLTQAVIMESRLSEVWEEWCSLRVKNIPHMLQLVRTQEVHISLSVSSFT